MSAPRKPRSRGLQSVAVPGDRALLERCGLVDASGRVSGAERMHPDAKLLAMVADYTTMIQTSQALYARLHNYKEDGRVYRRLWREMLSTREQEEQLELKILAIKAETKLGLLAKMGLYCDLHQDHTGSWLGRPMAVMREAMAMLGGDPIYAPWEPA